MKKFRISPPIAVVLILLSALAFMAVQKQLAADNFDQLTDRDSNRGSSFEN